jgi:hypothetical protein
MVRSGLVAAAILAVFGCAAFAVQALGFGTPSRAELELAQTVHRLGRYSVSHATIDLNGHRYRSICQGSWLGGMRIGEVTLQGRPPIVAIEGRLLHDTPIDWAAYQLAGCPRPLSKRIANELVAGGPIATSAGSRSGRPVYVVRMLARRPQFEILISAATKLPVELDLVGRRIRGRSLVAYGVQK